MMTTNLPMMTFLQMGSKLCKMEEMRVGHIPWEYLGQAINFSVDPRKEDNNFFKVLLVIYLSKLNDALLKYNKVRYTFR